jgi:hypothetical protein
MQITRFDASDQQRVRGEPTGRVVEAEVEVGKQTR